jgi:uncharacterized RDD family membrane protein YckC
MTQIPAGWYPDPSPENSTGAGMRYWDGAGWTEQVSAPQAPMQPAPLAYPVAPPVAPPSYPVAAQPGYQPYPSDQQYPAYPQYPTGVPGYYNNEPMTPDGQPLAGWWMRVLASLLDSLFLLPLYALVTLPILLSNSDEIRAWWNLHYHDGRFETNSSQPLPAVFDATTSQGLLFFGAMFAVGALYTIGFLRWKQATPGKLATGLRVRLRDRPELPWSANPGPLGRRRRARNSEFRDHRRGVAFDPDPAQLPLAVVGQEQAGAARQARQHQRGQETAEHRRLSSSKPS